MLGDPGAGPVGQTGSGLDVKVAKALDTLLRPGCGCRVADLNRRLGAGPLARRERQRLCRVAPAPRSRSPRRPTSRPNRTPPTDSDTADLDPIDRELVQIVLNEPERVALVIIAGGRRARSGTRRCETILQACYDLSRRGADPPTFERVDLAARRPAVAGLAAGLLLAVDAAPLSEARRPPPPWDDRLDRCSPSSPSATGRSGSAT